VLAAASYLEENARDLPDELREEVGTIKRNLQLEAQLIDDLLDLTRISRGKVELHPEAVDVAVALRHALDICSTDADTKELLVELHLDAPSHLVWGDATRLRQVFWNLLNNAVKFTPAHGRITIRTHSEDGERLLIEVGDNGPGIEPEVLGRIFNAFEQGERGVTRKFGGLGLGLAISKSLVEAHRGTIAAESLGRGQGATFRVCLPLMQDYRVAAPPAESTPAAPATPLRILLVEDHDDTRRILSRLLRQAGHDVLAAASVAMAREALEDSPFDLLISDLGLPDGDGLSVVREAKARQPLKAIAMSGFGMEEDISRSHAAGFDVHLTKPVDFHTLQQTVRDLGAKRAS
jgi:CheY-like chemotaxis protein/two-component sensor histidine kinase